MLGKSIRRWIVHKNFITKTPCINREKYFNKLFQITQLRYATFANAEMKLKRKSNIKDANVIRSLEAAYEQNEVNKSSKTRNKSNTLLKGVKECDNIEKKKEEKQSKEEQDIQNTFEIKQNSTKVNLENSTDSKQPKPSKIKSYGENIDNNLQNENDKDTWKAAISKIASIRGMFSNMNIDNQIPKIPNERELLLSQYDNQNFEPKEEKYKILEDAIKRIDRQSKNANRMMNPSGGLTGKPATEIKGDSSDYQHPVISKPNNKMEELLVNNYRVGRDEYASMIGKINNIDKVKYKKQDEVLKVPSETDITVVNRSKTLKDGFISSDEEGQVSGIDTLGERKIEDNVFIEIVNREQGQRINLKIPHPKDQNKDKIFKLYITHEDHKYMLDKLNTHTDVIVMIDGCSKSNPGKAGSGICFFGRKTHETNNNNFGSLKDNTQIVDITDNTRSEDNIFDILEREQKKEIIKQHRSRKAQQALKDQDDLEEREFLFGICINLGEASNNYAEYCSFDRNRIRVFSDSELVVNQIKGTMKVRHPILKKIIEQAHSLTLSFEEIHLNYIEREFNKAADTFAKEGAEMNKDYKYVFSLIDVVSSIKLS